MCIVSVNDCLVYSLFYSSPGLTVNITVNGTPPPGFTPRGPNEYRAASGPYNFTCTATGGAGSGNYMYMWTSSSSGSAFETSATSVISRLALHSGDSGIHTCTATRGGGQSGSNSINVTIVGEYYCWFGKVTIGGWMYVSMCIVTVSLYSTCA